jgi:hypothetical protein
MVFSAFIRRLSCGGDEDGTVPLRKLKRRGRVGSDFEKMRETVREKLYIDDRDDVFFRQISGVPWESSDCVTFENKPTETITDWRSSYVQSPVVSRRTRRLMKRRPT